MKFMVAIVALGLIAAAPLPGEYPFTAEQVIDGDTVKGTVTIWPGHSLEISVRVAGIDAPELRGACAREKALAREAKAFAEALIADDELLISHPMQGKYAGRIVADVIVLRGDERIDLATELKQAGLARAYDGGTRAPWCD